MKFVFLALLVVATCLVLVFVEQYQPVGPQLLRNGDFAEPAWQTGKAGQMLLG